MRISVWYHTRFRGHGIDETHAHSLFCAQILRLVRSELLNTTETLFVCVNGDKYDAAQIQRIADETHVPCELEIITHGMQERSEICTLQNLQTYAHENDATSLLYLHEKGVTYPSNDGLVYVWRECMTRHLIDGWRQQVSRLAGDEVDSCGCHWLTRAQYPGAVDTPFWGGNFWWATARYIDTLPALPTSSWEHRHLAESWIGSGVILPSVHDCHPAWPSTDCAYS